PAEPLETIAHLLFLERELGRIRQVLQAAAAAAAEVRARRLDALGRWDQHGVDDRAAEARAALEHPHPQTVTRQPAPDEDDVAVRPAHPFAAERQVVDDELQQVAALRLGHDSRHYKRGLRDARGLPGWSVAGPREYHSVS